MMKLLKTLVILLAIAAAPFVWSWFSSRKALADYVLKVQPGMQVTEARSYARQKGLKYVASPHSDEAGRFHDLVTSSGVMGRYVCEIQNDGTVVVKVTRRFND